ncbi:MAG: hypothetical protein LBS62_09320 [Clostridiales bacterium]|nr:hypothetical protein [Clostridiales bacterium]
MKSPKTGGFKPFCYSLEDEIIWLIFSYEPCMVLQKTLPAFSILVHD